MDIVEVIDRATLAKALGITHQQLAYILYVKKPENLYKTFSLPKKDGGIRTISAPQEPLKHVQRNLAGLLFKVQSKYYLNNNIAQGFVEKRGIITNAYQHRNKRYVLNMDLENFFDSIHFGRVKGFSKKIII